MIARAARKFPNDLEIVAAHARNASDRKDWPNALNRWKEVKERLESFLGPLGMARSLRELGRYGEAKQVTIVASEQFQKVPWIYVELEWCGTIVSTPPVPPVGRIAVPAPFRPHSRATPSAVELCASSSAKSPIGMWNDVSLLG